VRDGAAQWSRDRSKPVHPSGSLPRRLAMTVEAIIIVVAAANYVDILNAERRLHREHCGPFCFVVVATSIAGGLRSETRRLECHSRTLWTMHKYGNSTAEIQTL